MSLSVFKRLMLKTYRPSKKDIYGIHDPKGVQLLFQLRVNLSPLKHHKYSHHFFDTPNGQCLCNFGIETTCHFLLKCCLFTRPREVLLAKVNPILLAHDMSQANDDFLTEILLYGHVSLSFQENVIIMKATIDFLKASGRFAS